MSNSTSAAVTELALLRAMTARQRYVLSNQAKGTTVDQPIDHQLCNYVLLLQDLLGMGELAYAVIAEQADKAARQELGLK